MFERIKTCREMINTKPRKVVLYKRRRGSVGRFLTKHHITGAHCNFSPTFLEVYNVPHVKKDQISVIRHHLWLKKKKRRKGGNPTHCPLHVALEGSQRTWEQAVSGKGLGVSGGKETHLCPNFYTFTLLDLFTVCTPASGWGPQMRGLK